MAVGAVVVVVGLALPTGHRLTPAEARRADAELAAMQSKWAAEEEANRPARLLIVGDSYTGGSAMGGNGEQNWTALARKVLTDQGYRVDMTVSAGGGSGYTQGGTRGLTFQQLAEAGGRGFDVVVFFGSRNDASDPGSVRAAADAAFASVKSASPDARLLVIGPPWVDQQPPPEIVACREAVSAAAAEVKATWVDPLQQTWFPDGNTLIGADGVHPTDAGHQELERRILPLLKRELDALG